MNTVTLHKAARRTNAGRDKKACGRQPRTIRLITNQKKTDYERVHQYCTPHVNSFRIVGVCNTKMYSKRRTYFEDPRISGKRYSGTLRHSGTARKGSIHARR